MSKRLFVLAVLGVSLSAGLSAQPVISFESQAIVARGLPPGGNAVIFGVARESKGFHSRIVRRQQVLAADAAGQARLSLNQAVPRSSVWLAADLSSGAFRIAVPQRSPARELPFGSGRLEPPAPGRAGRVRSGLSFIEVLYLRPGRGVWGLTVGDGGRDDHDGRPDRSATAALDRLIPIGASPPPPSDFAAGDILLVVDARRLEFFAARLAAGR